MDTNHAIAGAGRASLIAGPCFTLSAIAAALYLKLPEPVIIRPVDVMGTLGILIPATIVGAILGFLPSLLGSAVLGWLAGRISLLRFPLIWPLVGGGLAAIFARTDMPDEWRFAFIVTGALCAMVCRRHWEWD
jgi:hypothetical protein